MSAAHSSSKGNKRRPSRNPHGQYSRKFRSRQGMLTKEPLLVERSDDSSREDIRKHLTDEKYALLRVLVLLFKRSVTKVPIVIDHAVGSTRMLALATLRSEQFATAIPDFYQLTPNDRTVLLRSAVVRVSWMRYALLASNATTINGKLASYPPVILQKYSSGFRSLLTNITTHLANIPMDEPTLVIVLAAMCFSIEEPDLQEVCKVAVLQTRYLSILYKYLQWRHGSSAAATLYSKILGVMAEFRSMLGPHNRMDQNIWLDDCEIQQLNSQLGNISPYWNYSFEQRDSVSFNCTDLPPQNSTFLSEARLIDSNLLQFMNLTVAEDAVVEDDFLEFMKFLDLWP